jgi:hypothetical protein
MEDYMLYIHTSNYVWSIAGTTTIKKPNQGFALNKNLKVPKLDELTRNPCKVAYF